jgi:hypothetical protein
MAPVTLLGLDAFCQKLLIREGLAAEFQQQR